MKSKPKKHAKKHKTTDIQKKEYTEVEREAIAQYIKEQEFTLTPVVFEAEKGNETDLKMVYEDSHVAFVTVTQTAGTPYGAFNSQLIRQVVNASFTRDSEAEAVANAVTAAMLSIRPRNALEGMLAGQLVAVHNQAMESLRRAGLKDQPYEIALNHKHLAIRLMKTYARLLEALIKCRSGGQQNVVVKHVYVNSGGQAVVGNVIQGEGAMKKSVSEPHATTPRLVKKRKSSWRPK